MVSAETCEAETSDTSNAASGNSGRILFLSKGEHSPSIRFRALAYFPLMRRAGWIPSHCSFSGAVSGSLRLLKQASQSDIVVLQRLLPISVLRILIRKAARRLVFDFDDAVFLRSSGSAFRLRRQRFEALARSCDEVWAGNAYLAGAASRVNSRVRVLATTIDPDDYPVLQSKPADGFRPIWIGSASTGRYLRLILPALEELGRSISDLNLKVVADFQLSACGFSITNRNWTRQAEGRELAESHVGLAPLPDNAWTRGKCGLKILQYMAAGLPVVASPVGVQREMVEHGQTGFWAETEEEWIGSLLRLAGDPGLRRRMGEAGRERVAKFYSHGVSWPILQDALLRLKP